MTVNGGIDGNDNYVSAPIGTNVPARSNVALETEIHSLELYNNAEIQLFSIARGATPLLTTILAIGRQMAGGNFKDLGVTEKISKNYPDHKFKEQDEQQETYVVVTGGNSSATTLVVASTLGLSEGIMLRNVETNEQLRVVSVTNSTTFVVERSVGNVSADTISTSDRLFVVGTAAGAGIAKVGTVGVSAADKFNYFHKELTTVQFTDQDMMTYKVQGIGIKNIIAEKSVTHFRELEKHTLFSQIGSGTDSAGNPYYTMEGTLEHAKRGWTHDISNSLTRGTLEEAFGYPLRYLKNGSTSKIAVCGTRAKARISELFENRILVNQIRDIDLTLNSIEINNGKFTLLNHPMLDENSGYQDHIMIIDPAYTTVVYPSGTDMNNAGFNGKTRFEYLKNESNFAKQVGSYVTYLTLELVNSNSGGLFKVA